MTEPDSKDAFKVRRAAMVQLQLRDRGIRDPRVLRAMGIAPRHEFVPVEERSLAYEDCPLPIGEGQTISQPYIVATMLEALEIQSHDVVLEVGTGSGYEAAVLAELASVVWTIERNRVLAAQAGRDLERLGYERVHVEVGDGSLGWPSAAPFDAIVVAAASPRVPAALFAQLKEGGRIIVPVGSTGAQVLQLVRKVQGQPVITQLDPCRFVPLVGAEGFVRA